MGQIFNYGKQYNYFVANYLSLDKIDENSNFIFNYFSRGCFFTIIIRFSPIVNSNNILQLSNNQYGTGPLLIVKSLNNFGFTMMDSIVLGTVLVNFLIFVIIFCGQENLIFILNTLLFCHF